MHHNANIAVYSYFRGYRGYISLKAPVYAGLSVTPFVTPL
nr:MAG TPA: hypothetical protein [Caudoviricetes sp.]